MHQDTPTLPQDAVPSTLIDFARRLPELGRHCELLGLHGSAAAALLARLLPASDTPFCILAPDHLAAERLFEDLAFHAGGADGIYFFPHWGINPYEPLNPHLELETTRIVSLAALLQGKARAVVLPARALMQRVIPKDTLAELCFTLRPGDEFSRSRLLSLLVKLGYNSTPLVEERGTFSMRGDILDLFPPTTANPARVDFFGDEVERIRLFDPATQRTVTQETAALEILPVREMILTEENLEVFSRKLKKRCDDLGLPRPLRESILADIREGLLFPGCSSLLPLNYEKLDSFFDYAGAARWIISDPTVVVHELERFAAAIEEGSRRCSEKKELYTSGEEFYLPAPQIEKRLEKEPRIEIQPLEYLTLKREHPVFRFTTVANTDLRLDSDEEKGGMAALAGRLEQWARERWTILLVCRQQGQAERLLDLLAGHDLHPGFHPQGKPPDLHPGSLGLTLGNLSAGFRLPEEKLAVITEDEIFGPRGRHRTGRKSRPKDLLSSFAELRDGDFVVHADHGIARFHGLLHLKTNAMEGDFLHLEYAGGDKLYLPVDRIEKVSKYVGAEGQAPRLDKMGGNAWEKAVLKARAAVEELARQLLKIYAQRELNQGFAYSPPDPLYREFEATFPYEETEDQLTAIQDVLKDMASSRPMDRLICGDVGYGKTEVAIRAAFRAVMDGKQVAVLVPTTVLAQQHLETFRERFSNYPIQVDMVSRFRSPTEQKGILARTGEGKVDILIGTHRLLQRDIRFRDLGLLIIDEEQRFGVKHKEKLKRFRAEIDVLTLTATPIPRTLHLSLTGLRDLSIINTPPVDRQAIRTYVTKFDDDLIREAVLRELRRGGQVFFVHNRVHTIDAMANLLRRLIPEAKLAVAHGQMAEGELEKVMLDFVAGRSNLLVCTTIIENGLDIPRANTIIVNRADCFGLSQLYQLRGRVGRSHQRAYAYLLIPASGAVTAEARERLRVLQALTELGAGFNIASHDLEIRGAGELLGAQQSGHVAAVGFEMYTELLEETIHEMQGMARTEQIDPEIKLGLSAFFPEKYIPDPNQRLNLYKKLAAAESEGELYDLVDELTDRYGRIPEPGMALIEVMKLRVLMKRLKITLAEHDGRELSFSFHAATPVQPDKLLGLIQEVKGRYTVTPDFRLLVKTGKLAAEERLQTAKKELLRFLELC
ncbi:MAG: transcription-repair coupling factor [Desulfuromonadaceae bacterium]|nr:transcription-repair coupling factor [Desulfuromonadaceae bacterium]